VAVVVQVAGVAGAEPAVAVLLQDVLGRVVRVFVVALHDHRPGELDFAVGGDAQLDARRGRADAGELDVVVAVDGRPASHFG